MNVYLMLRLGLGESKAIDSYETGMRVMRHKRSMMKKTTNKVSVYCWELIKKSYTTIVVNEQQITIVCLQKTLVLKII